MLHRVKMIQTTLAADHDGINPKHYMKGHSYTISDYLLGSFISMGVVEIAAPEYQSEEEPEFAVEEIQENKAIQIRRRGRPRKNDK